MMIPVTLPPSIDAIPIPTRIQELIRDDRLRIQTFQDRWNRPQIEQFVAADYELVWQTLRWVSDSVPRVGQRFLEWGCGFAVVSALAATLGFEAMGIESESDLLQEGRQTIELWDVDVELFHGNFLPPESEQLADDPTLPSLGHPMDAAYEQIGLNLDDFAVVYSYPWPGEEFFHQQVFERYADDGALLIQFCGPNDMQCHRRTRRQDPHFHLR